MIDAVAVRCGAREIVTGDPEDIAALSGMDLTIIARTAQGSNSNRRPLALREMTQTLCIYALFSPDKALIDPAFRWCAPARANLIKMLWRNEVVGFLHDARLRGSRNVVRDRPIDAIESVPLVGRDLHAKVEDFKC